MTEPIVSSFFTSMLTNALKEGLEYLVNNPDALENLKTSFFGIGCHNAVDVAQDALDAYDHGYLTRQQAIDIVTICLKEQNPTVDIRSKKVELEKLFS